MNIKMCCSRCGLELEIDGEYTLPNIYEVTLKPCICILDEFTAQDVLLDIAEDEIRHLERILDDLRD